MANKNITQLTPQTGSADPTSLLYTVTGGNTDKSLPLSVLFNGPTFTNTVTFSGPILGGTGTPITLPGNSSFYAPSAVISRLRDRVFVGDAVLNNGTSVASQPDWLTTYQIAKGRTYGYVQTSQMSVLNSSAGGDSLTTLVVGAQSTGRTGSASQVIAVTGMGVNNSSGNVGASQNQAWAGYFEAFRDTGTAGNGGAYGIEIDTMNYVSAAAVTDPYGQSGDQTVGVQMASGGGFSGTLYPTTVGVNFQNNNASFDKGIVFGSTSITGANGTTGTGVAIAFGRGHTIQWYGSAGVTTSSILSTGTVTASAIQQLFSDNTATFNNASGKSILKVLGVASGVNGLQVLGATTGNSPALQAIGDDTNVSVQVTAKGTGSILLNNPVTVTGVLAATGLTGTTSGAAPAASDIGSVNTATFSAVNITTSNTNQNLVSLVVGAGIWDITGNVLYNAAATTTTQILVAGISTTSVTLPAAGNYAQLTATMPVNAANSLILPVQRINVTTNTTVYLVGLAVFGTSTMSATGFIRALRVH